MNDNLPVFNCLIIALTAYASWQGFQNDLFREAHLLSTRAVLMGKQYRRLFAAGFLHLDWQHLLFNMFSLYAFGSGIERVFGAPVFLLIYFSAILGGNLLSLFLHRHHEYRALGASGGVCGIIFASIFLFPGGGIMVFPLPIAIPSWLYAILFLVLSSIAMRSQLGNIGHDAHIGGAIIGLVVTTLIQPGIIGASPILYGVIMTLSVGLLVYMTRHPLHLETGNPFSRNGWKSFWSRFTSGGENFRKGHDAMALDRLLEKISRTGMDSLTDGEKARLKALSDRKRVDDEREEKRRREAWLNYRR